MTTILGTKPIYIPEVSTLTGSGLNGSATTGSGFADALGAAITQVDSTSRQAKSAAIELLGNGNGDVHSVALATQRAELSMELFQQVRNKFVQAYQEIMKMPM